MIHPGNTFSPTDLTTLIDQGYCIGYDIDGNPQANMACHPETGWIVRSFWSGWSLWHPSLHRTSERVVNRHDHDMSQLLYITIDMAAVNHIFLRDWNMRFGADRLATLRSLAAAGNNETISRENV